MSAVPLKNCQTSMEVFYINIYGFISMSKFLYETLVLDNSYLRYKVQLPTSDSTEITASGINVTLDTPSGKIHLYLTRELYHI